jgi:ABC-2 type transport system ATP-binding protein
VRVASPDAAGLAALVAAGGWPGAQVAAGVVELTDTDVATVGHAAHAAGLELHELATQGAGLEDVFLRLTSPQAAGQGAHAAPPGPATAVPTPDPTAGGAR